MKKQVVVASILVLVAVGLGAGAAFSAPSAARRTSSSKSAAASRRVKANTGASSDSNNTSNSRTRTRSAGKTASEPRTPIIVSDVAGGYFRTGPIEFTDGELLSMNDFYLRLMTDGGRAVVSAEPRILAPYSSVSPTASYNHVMNCAKQIYTKGSDEVTREAWMKLPEIQRVTYTPMVRIEEGASYTNVCKDGREGYAIYDGLVNSPTAPSGVDATSARIVSYVAFKFKGTASGEDYDTSKISYGDAADGTKLSQLRILYTKAQKDYEALAVAVWGTLGATDPATGKYNVSASGSFASCTSEDISGTSLDGIMTAIKLGTISSGVQAVGGGLQLAGGIMQKVDEKKIESAPWSKKVGEGEEEAIETREGEIALGQLITHDSNAFKTIVGKITENELPGGGPQTNIGGGNTFTEAQNGLTSATGNSSETFYSEELAAAAKAGFDQAVADYRTTVTQINKDNVGKEASKQKAIPILTKQTLIDAGIKAIEAAKGSVTKFTLVDNNINITYIRKEFNRKISALAMTGTIVGVVGGAGAAVTGGVTTHGGINADDTAVKKAVNAVSTCESGVSAVTSTYEKMPEALPDIESYNWTTLPEGDIERYNRNQAIYNNALSGAAQVNSKCSGISGNKFNDAFIALVAQTYTGGVGAISAVGGAIHTGLSKGEGVGHIIGGGVNFAAGAAGTIVGALSWKDLGEQIDMVKACSGAAGSLKNRMTVAMKPACNDKETCEGDDCCILPALAGEYGSVAGLSQYEQKSVDDLRTEAARQFNSVDTNYNRVKTLAAKVEDLCARYSTKCADNSNSLGKAIADARALFNGSSGSVNTAYTSARAAKDNIAQSTYEDNGTRRNMTVVKATEYLQDLTKESTNMSRYVDQMNAYLTQAQNAGSDAQNESDIGKSAVEAAFSSAQTRYAEAVQKFAAAINTTSGQTPDHYARAKKAKENMDKNWATITSAKQALDLATGSNVAAKVTALKKLLDEYPGTTCAEGSAGCSCDDAATPVCSKDSFSYDLEALNLNLGHMYTNLAEVKSAATTDYYKAQAKYNQAVAGCAAHTAAPPGSDQLARMKTEWSALTTAYQKVNTATTVADAAAKYNALRPLIANPCPTEVTNCFYSDANAIFTGCGW